MGLTVVIELDLPCFCSPVIFQKIRPRPPHSMSFKTELLRTSSACPLPTTTPSVRRPPPRMGSHEIPPQPSAVSQTPDTATTCHPTQRSLLMTCRGRTLSFSDKGN